MLHFCGYSDLDGSMHNNYWSNVEGFVQASLALVHMNTHTYCNLVGNLNDWMYQHSDLRCVYSRNPYYSVDIELEAR